MSSPSLPETAYARILELALQEDLSASDLTSDATVDPQLNATATATAKSPLVVCGADVFFATFRKLDPECETRSVLIDGQHADAGQPIWIVRGKARALLMAERTALNFAQRMSGIASLARHYVRQLPPDSPTRVVDTRKTTPGLRALERYAVRIGGAKNHRDNLGSAVLIKDNHIIAAGGVTQALERARRYAPHSCRLEVEVTSLEMLDQALQARADVIMLDNFDPSQIAEAVQRCRGRALVEVSGGITAERVTALANAGVDVISVGALTHSAQASDISLGIALD